MSRSGFNVVTRAAAWQDVSAALCSVHVYVEVITHLHHCQCFKDFSSRKKWAWAYIRIYLQLRRYR